MRNRILRLQKPLLLMLCSLPVCLLISHLYMPGRQGLWCLMPGLYLLLACLCLLPPGRLRLPCGLAGSAAMIAAALCLLPWHEHLWVLLLPVMYIVLLLLFLKMGGWTPDMELRPTVPMIGAVCYILLQFVTGLKPDTYADMIPPLHIGFLLFLLLALLYMNRLSLRSAMMDGTRRPPEQLRRRNTLLVWAAFFGAVLVSLIPAIGDGLIWLWDRFKQAIGWFMELIGRLGAGSSSGASGGSGDGMGALEAAEDTEPGLLSVILQYVTIAAACLIAAVLLVLAVRLLGKKLKVLLRRMLERLKLYGA